MREHELLQCKSGLAVEFCVVLSYNIKMESGFWTNQVVLDDFHSCATADHVDTDKRLPRNTNANIKRHLTVFKNNMHLKLYSDKNLSKIYKRHVRLFLCWHNNMKKYIFTNIGNFPSSRNIFTDISNVKLKTCFHLRLNSRRKSRVNKPGFLFFSSAL